MDFSTLYDLFQSDVDYESLLKPVLPYLNKNHIILDAGCGSGHILKYLLQQNYDVIGVDIDENMLALAQKKLLELNHNNHLFLHDLRKPIKHKFHQIISLLDVFHYFKGIYGVAKNLYHALYDEGILIIDLYKEPQHFIETGTILDMKYIWEVSTKNERIHHKINLGNEQTFHIKQYYYEPSYYINVLKSVGFSIKTFDGFDDRKMYLVCTK